MAKTILVIDDDEMIRMLVGAFLKKDDYAVLTAADGPSGIEHYAQDRPDLVVIDIAMPGMTGFEVASRIREIQESEQRPHTPIIILTAYARSFMQSAPADARVDSYLTKPVTADQILRHVHQFLDE
jgi:CheY-like chemotaxis protein